jgi:hypothetical protein
VNVSYLRVFFARLRRKLERELCPANPELAGERDQAKLRAPTR